MIYTASITIATDSMKKSHDISEHLSDSGILNHPSAGSEEYNLFIVRQNKSLVEAQKWVSSVANVIYAACKENGVDKITYKISKEVVSGDLYMETQLKEVR